MAQIAAALTELCTYLLEKNGYLGTYLFAKLSNLTISGSFQLPGPAYRANLSWLSPNHFIIVFRESQESSMSAQLRHKLQCFAIDS